NTITPFQLSQNWPVSQGQRFSQIRFGSQVDLIIPLTPGRDFALTQAMGTHVEAGVDTLVRIGPSNDGGHPSGAAVEWGQARSEERRVGKECRSRGGRDYERKKKIQSVGEWDVLPWRCSG